MEYLLDLAPLLAIIAALVGLVFWWQWRGNRKKGREHAEALAAFAGALGGRVVGPEEAEPWSAELLAPLRDETDGVINRMGMASRRRYETALDFRRGRWSVRVGEASVQKSIDNGTRTAYELRIEVATSPVTPMRVSHRSYLAKDLFGRPLPPDNVEAQGGELVREVPVTVARGGGQWVRVALPPGPFDTRFAVFTSDPAAATRAFGPRAVEHLLDQGDALPRVLHFEAGLVFGTVPDRIDPDHVLRAVDAILGLLDRMGVAPGQLPR
ncbi:MAG: hypothetical protein HOV94_25520 [Saccharothrix sp.]|nr:hypothetical protein [Saccharothrix sp.]